TVAVDTTQAIKPIKGPIAAPLTFAELFPWILLIVAVLLIGAALFYYYKKRKKKQPVVFARPKPKIPPHRWALDELEKLRNEKLWQKNLIKLYHSRLTEIVRQYLDDRFGIMAPEMTSQEIMQAAYDINLPDKNLRELQQILELADLVKFAKYTPIPGENSQSMQQATDFVKDTAPASGNKTEKMNGSNEYTKEAIAEAAPTVTRNESYAQ
ncbi:MAG: LPXTG cell wall anchor domain-containing protein, partial [Bacteroidales bacterium]|nr:LPXTG cell wall anchor domain-containing protein [Bacteroidales bacterium]